MREFMLLFIGFPPLCAQVTWEKQQTADFLKYGQKFESQAGRRHTAMFMSIPRGFSGLVLCLLLFVISLCV